MILIEACGGILGEHGGQIERAIIRVNGKDSGGVWLS